MLWRMLETQAEWKARLAREDAFWNRPNDQVLSDLAVRYQRPPQPSNFPNLGKSPLYSSSNVVSLAEWKKVRS